MDNIPSKLILTCRITGKQVTWTNKTIIAAKIAQYGSLEAFMAQYTSRGASHKAPAGGAGAGTERVPETRAESAASFGKPKPIIGTAQEILQEGVSLPDAPTEMVHRVYPSTKEGDPICHVYAPKPPVARFAKEGNSSAGSSAERILAADLSAGPASNSSSVDTVQVPEAVQSGNSQPATSTVPAT